MLEKLRKERGDEGFTLIELLVVIIIIGILAAIAIPVFLNQRQKGWEAAVKSDLRNAATAQETYLTESNSYLAGDVAALSGMGFKYSDAKNYSASGAVITALTLDNRKYCLNATAASGKSFNYSSPDGLKDGVCVQPVP